MWPHLISVKLRNLPGSGPRHLKAVGPDPSLVKRHVVRPPRDGAVLRGCRVRDLVLADGLHADVVGAAGDEAVEGRLGRSGRVAVLGDVRLGHFGVGGVDGDLRALGNEWESVWSGFVLLQDWEITFLILIRAVSSSLSNL